MGLRPQRVEVRFGGLNTKFDPKLAIPGILDVAENLRANRMTTPEGAIELVKRNGTTSLTRTIDNASVGAGASITAGKRIGAYGDELLVADGKYLHSYAPSLDKWRVRGKLPLATATVERILGMAGSGGARQNVDIAYAGGIYVMTLYSGGEFRVYVIDGTTGQLMARNAGTAADASVPFAITGQQPRLVAIGSTVFICYHDGAATLKCQTIAAATPTTISAATNLATDAHATLRWDVTVDTVNSRLVIAYRDNAAFVTLKSFNTALVQQATIQKTFAPDVSIGFLAHDFSDAQIYVAWCSSATGVQVATYTTALAYVGVATCDGAVTTARNVTGVYASGPHVLWEVPGSPTSRTVIRYRNGASASADDFCRSVGLAGKMFRADGQYYVPVAHENTSERSVGLMVFDGTTPGTPNTDGSIAIAGAFLLGDSAGLTETQSLLPSVAAVSATQFVIPLPTMEEAATVGGTTWGVARADLTLGTTAPSVNYAGSHWFPGAVMFQYDGSSVVEGGFLVRPPAPLLTQAAGGALTAVATYQYVAVYRWRDRTGRLHWSRPSAPASITLTGGNQTVNLTVETLRWTMKGPKFNKNSGGIDLHDVEIEIYRTAGNGSVPRLRAILGSGVTTDTNTLADTTADSTIATNEKLYTEGEVANGTPPCPRILHVCGPRMWAVVNAADLWFTKEPDEGYGAEFAIAFRLPLDPGQGDVTALASMDGRVLIGRATRWSVLAGAGPDARGDGAYDFPTPLTARSGPVDQNGVSETPDGVYYRSIRGIWQLDRGLAEQYVGAQVETWNSLTVTGATVCAHRPEVRFATSDGRTLAYDWHLKQWFTDITQAAVASTLWGSTWVYLKSDGTVVKEVVGQTDDDGAAITSVFEIAWLSPFGLGGHGRIWKFQFLGEYMGAHTLKATIALDFSPLVTHPLTIVAPGAGVFGGWSPFGIEPVFGAGSGAYRVEGRSPVQRCTSFKLRVEDVLSTPSAGFKLSGIVLVAGFENAGVKPLPTIARMT